MRESSSFHGTDFHFLIPCILRLINIFFLIRHRNNTLVLVKEGNEVLSWRKERKKWKQTEVHLQTQPPSPKPRSNQGMGSSEKRRICSGFNIGLVAVLAAAVVLSLFTLLLQRGHVSLDMGFIVSTPTADLPGASVEASSSFRAEEEKSWRNLPDAFPIQKANGVSGDFETSIRGSRVVQDWKGHEEVLMTSQDHQKKEQFEEEEEDEVIPEEIKWQISCDKSPVRFECQNYGFLPTKPLLPQDVRLCDRERHNHMPHGDKESLCPDDPTCVKCKPDYELNLKAINLFREKSMQDRRRAVFERKFTKRLHSGRVVKLPVVVVGFNSGQTFFFMNWVCSCEAIGIDPREFTYIIPTDREAYDYVVARNFTAEPLDWRMKANLNIRSQYKGHANVGPHGLINTFVAAGAESVLLEEYPTILMDVDLIWLKNVRRYIASVVHPGDDMVGSFSPRDDAYGYMNGGFIYFSPTKASKLFLSSFVNMCSIKRSSDQIILNMMARYYKFRYLHINIFPMSDINTHWSQRRLRHLKNGEMPQAVHAVGVNKGPRFQVLNLWFLKPSCKSFDQTLIDDALKLNLLNKTMLR